MTKWDFYWLEEWSQLWSSCNWYDITPIKIQFEFDRVMGDIEFTFMILGLGFHCSYIYNENAETRVFCVDAVRRIRAGENTGTVLDDIFKEEDNDPPAV